MSLETVSLETKSVSALNKYDTADGISICILPVSTTDSTI